MNTYFQAKTKLKRLVGFSSTSLLSRLIPGAVFVGILAATVWYVAASAPRSFNAPRIVRIEEGTTLQGGAKLLKEQHIIRSETVFIASALILGGEHSLIAGDYYFAAPQNVVVVGNRLSAGDYNLEPLKVTVPEGSTIADIADILSDKLLIFDREQFLALAEGKEGYLFPDTYYFRPTESPALVLSAMEENFYKRIEPLRDDIVASGRSLHDIVTMASLLEEEARTTQSRKMISGILWKRIALGMRLQVDAVFPYIIGKNTFEVTKKDLLVDSPYNTYLYEGLPLGAISNPGLNSIEAAVNPTPSQYLYYLSDHGGGMHYSKTYEQHLLYKRQYLDS